MTSGGRADSARLTRAVAEIDRLNAQDPTFVDLGDGPRPKESVHAERMTACVLALDPSADDVQLAAARAHHLRRWRLPRSEYPEGRAGYLRWRTESKRRHAAEVAPLLAAAGYTEAEIERVGRIIRKEGLGTDPAVDTHEDALCLVFFELRLADVAGRLDPVLATGVLDRTARKMTPRGRLAARRLVGRLPEPVAAALLEALDGADRPI